MKNIFLIVLFSICTFRVSFTQNTEDFHDKIAGASVSTLSGLSLYILTDLTHFDNLRISFLTIPTQDEDDVLIHENESKPMFSFGLEYQRDLLESRRLRLHFLAGAAIDNTLYRFEECNSSSTTCFYTNTGIGLGFDIEIVKGFVFNIHSTYQISHSHGDIRDKYYGLGGGIGIGIHLKQKID